MKHQSQSSNNNGGPLTVLLAAVGLSLVLTVIAAWAAGAVNFWFPQQASTVAGQVDHLFDIITWISIFFFVLIVILMVWFVIKYRRKDNYAKATSDVTHNTPLELTWTIIPLILVIGIFYAGMAGYLNLRAAPAGAYEVNVLAQRWSWTFTHRNGCSTNVLYVPVGRPVRLVMESSDVLHALFIPAFRVKQDIVPGRVTDLWFQATEPGTYDLFCAEYCGKDHSQMHTLVIAVPDDELNAVLEECIKIFDRTPDDKLHEEAMKRLFNRCASCHTIDGRNSTGPTWRDLWKHVQEGEVVFSDGTVLKDLMGPGKMFETPEDYLRQSILNPQQKIVMNYPASMPTFKGMLKDREVTAMVELIKRLDEFNNEGKLINAAPEGGATAK